MNGLATPMLGSPLATRGAGVRPAAPWQPLLQQRPRLAAVAAWWAAAEAAARPQANVGVAAACSAESHRPDLQRTNTGPLLSRLWRSSVKATCGPLPKQQRPARSFALPTAMNDSKRHGPLQARSLPRCPDSLASRPHTLAAHAAAGCRPQPKPAPAAAPASRRGAPFPPPTCSCSGGCGAGPPGLTPLGPHRAQSARLQPVRFGGGRRAGGAAGRGAGGHPSRRPGERPGKEARQHEKNKQGSRVCACSC